jgi:hypothetical protein
LSLPSKHLSPVSEGPAYAESAAGKAIKVTAIARPRVRKSLCISLSSSRLSSRLNFRLEISSSDLK